MQDLLCDFAAVVWGLGWALQGASAGVAHVGAGVHTSQVAFGTAKGLALLACGASCGNAAPGAGLQAASAGRLVVCCAACAQQAVVHINTHVSTRGWVRGIIGLWFCSVATRQA